MVLIQVRPDKMSGLIWIQTVWHLMDFFFKKLIQKKKHYFNSLPSSGVSWYPLQTVWTQVRPDKMSGLIWIQTVWHFDGNLERIFWKSWFWKNTILTLCLLVSSADSLCKQFGPRSGPTKCPAWSGSKLNGTLMVILKEFFEKVDSEKISRRQKSMQNYPGSKELMQYVYEPVYKVLLPINYTISDRYFPKFLKLGPGACWIREK